MEKGAIGQTTQIFFFERLRRQSRSSPFIAYYNCKIPFSACMLQVSQLCVGWFSEAVSPAVASEAQNSRWDVGKLL